MANDYLESDDVIVSAFPTHPGQMLRAEITGPRGITGVELARATGITRPDMTNILAGKKSITPLNAARIEAALGYSADILLVMQSRHDLAAVRREAAPKIEAVRSLAA